MTSESNTLALFGGTPAREKSMPDPSWPPINETTADRLREVYMSGQWSFNSPAEQEFEKAFAEYHGAKHGISMVNGTVTLEAALAVNGVGPGDEVIVPALTWMATAMAVHYVGATPVFVDIEPTTLCLDPQKVEEAITSKTRAIIPVHLYGGMADMEKLLAIAAKHDLALIEDCAHMQGGKWDGRGVGSWGSVGSFSFQQSKTVASGEGGICLTNDDELADKLYKFKHIGYGRGAAQGGAQQGPPEGLACHNYRFTGLQAVILSEQVKQLGDLIGRMNRNADTLESELGNIEGLRFQSRGRLASPQGYYAWMMIFDEGPLADLPGQAIVEAAGAENIPVGSTYGPVYKHMLFNLSEDKYRIADGGCPVADTIGAQRTFGVLHWWLSADDTTIQAISKTVQKIAANAELLKEKYSN